MKTAKELLTEHFVPRFLGVAAISREHFIRDHCPEFHHVLYNRDKPRVVILYVDGTYIDIPKSSNFRVLRQSYSLHKHKHLLKAIMIVAPDGYILDVHGPYFSDSANNDASILIQQLQDNINGLRDWLQEDDVFVVDRGYRDSLDYLEALGIRTKMPSFLRQGQRQFTTEEANESRLITKTRWIIEAKNGHIKSKFKFFRDKVPIQHLSSVGDFFKICCAIINAYCPTIEMEGKFQILVIYNTITRNIFIYIIIRESLPFYFQVLMQF